MLVSLRRSIALAAACVTILCAVEFDQALAATYLTSHGSAGSGPGQLSLPQSVALDAAGNIYVGDVKNYRIEVLNSVGDYVRAWGSFGIGQGQFEDPYGVDVIADSVYVCDAAMCRIQVFTTSGAFVRTWGSYGGGWQQLNGPWAIDCDVSGNVYVADTYNSRVMSYVGTGSARWSWSPNGFSAPRGVACDGSGTVYVGTGAASPIAAVTTAGVLLRSWGSNGSGDGQTLGIEGMDVGPDGHVFVTDYGNGRVSEYLPDGTWVESFGTHGTGDGQFGTYSPTDVAVGADGRVYVCDRDNNRIQVWQLGSGTAVAPSTWGAIKALYKPSK